MRRISWWQIATGKSAQIGRGIPARHLIYAMKFPACMLTECVKFNKKYRTLYFADYSCVLLKHKRARVQVHACIQKHSHTYKLLSQYSVKVVQIQMCYFQSFGPFLKYPFLTAAFKVTFLWCVFIFILLNIVFLTELKILNLPCISLLFTVSVITYNYASPSLSLTE